MLVLNQFLVYFEILHKWSYLQVLLGNDNEKELYTSFSIFILWWKRKA
ncbi:hypothetical protein J5U22_01589 [Saccharolobus shibatae]|uniref:Uncharacterized protein n=1 Tax=Saccharolobus shibatae TaxID=2286 RepID=A0A8F5GX38_9CREN|nr:hypothetical protein J5U21_01708 [Saccharolobus shibatae]QXJ35042.1 hypothetical protein J5U22_01589 [Saccharolobus shibatae]